MTRKTVSLIKAMLLPAALAIPLALASLSPGFSMGSDSSEQSSKPAEASECGPNERKSFWSGKCVARNAAEACPRGEVISSQTGKCVKQSSSLSREEIDDRFAHALRLTHQENYRDAIRVLHSIAYTKDVETLTQLGFAYRMSGRVIASLDYYKAALAVDPNATRTREYMGEAYIQLGQFDRARFQLAAIEARCGTTCEEYVSLHGKLKTLQEL